MIRFALPRSPFSVPFGVRPARYLTVGASLNNAAAKKWERQYSRAQANFEQYVQHHASKYPPFDQIPEEHQKIFTFKKEQKKWNRILKSIATPDVKVPKSSPAKKSKVQGSKVQQTMKSVTEEKVRKSKTQKAKAQVTKLVGKSSNATSTTANNPQKIKPAENTVDSSSAAATTQSSPVEMDTASAPVIEKVTVDDQSAYETPESAGKAEKTTVVKVEEIELSESPVSVKKQPDTVSASTTKTRVANLPGSDGIIKNTASLSPEVVDTPSTLKDAITEQEKSDQEMSQPETTTKAEQITCAGMEYFYRELNAKPVYIRMMKNMTDLEKNSFLEDQWNQLSAIAKDLYGDLAQ